jgi:hypothetical protein
MGWVREDPRFLAFMRDLGMEDLWQVRGFPAGCAIATGPGGDRLTCQDKP